MPCFHHEDGKSLREVAEAYLSEIEHEDRRDDRHRQLGFTSLK